METFVVELEGVPVLHQGYRTTGGTVYWSLKFLHHELAQRGYSKKPYQFMSSLVDLLEGVPFIDKDRDAKAKPPVAEVSKVPQHLMTTDAFVTCLTAIVSRNQTEKAAKEACATWARGLAEILASSVRSGNMEGTLHNDGEVAVVSLNRLGVVTGTSARNKFVALSPLQRTPRGSCSGWILNRSRVWSQGGNSLICVQI